MTVLQTLYAEDPFLVWFGLSGLLVGLSLASGWAAPLVPALGALAAGLLSLTGVRLGLAVELPLAIVVSGLLVAARVAAGRTVARMQAMPPPAPPAAQLVGRVGFTAGEFVNGVGRVQLDDAEWSAELAQGEDAAPAGVAVRVTQVVGGVKLKVEPVLER